MEDDLDQQHLDGVEERIRSLEAVAFRARQRQRRRLSHAPIQIVNYAGEVVTIAHLQDEDKVFDEGVGVDVIGEMVGDGSTGKTNEVEGFAANMFHCNICLNRAKDPVLTCCGHLFCWSCFLNLPYAYSKAKECPVCKGEVTDESIITIYGNSNVHSSGKLKFQDPVQGGLRVFGRGSEIEEFLEEKLRFCNFFGSLGYLCSLRNPHNR